MGAVVVFTLHCVWINIGVNAGCMDAKVGCYGAICRCFDAPKHFIGAVPTP